MPSTLSQNHLLLQTQNSPNITLSGFEGPEKTIEIWFREPLILPPSPPASAASVHSSDDEDFSSSTTHDDLDRFLKLGLRQVQKIVWDDMLEIVKAQVLSFVSNEYCDAYLLSESSMFVYPYKIILKTCGTTTLLNALPKILQIAKELCNLQKVETFFYSRKSFLYPEKQIFPHGKWGDEVSFLEKIFTQNNFETSAYIVGKFNSDHWCLYVATPLDSPPSLKIPSPDFVISDRNNRHVDDEDQIYADLSDKDNPTIEPHVFEIIDKSENDVTLELMMHGLDKSTMKKFWREYYKTSDLSPEPEDCDTLNATGIGNLYPTSIIDDHAFDPCGYSLNGLLGPHYFTIHVTPEDHCSYASFETSIPEVGGVHEVVKKVIEIFNPASVSATLFTRSAGIMGKDYQMGLLEGMDEVVKAVEGFKVCERIVHALGKWEVVFIQMKKK